MVYELTVKLNFDFLCRTRMLTEWVLLLTALLSMTVKSMQSIFIPTNSSLPAHELKVDQLDPTFPNPRPGVLGLDTNKSRDCSVNTSLTVECSIIGI